MEGHLNDVVTILDVILNIILCSIIIYGLKEVHKLLLKKGGDEDGKSSETKT